GSAHRRSWNLREHADIGKCLPAGIQIEAPDLLLGSWRLRWSEIRDSPLRPRNLARRTPVGSDRLQSWLRAQIQFPNNVVVVQVVRRRALKFNLTMHDHIAAVGDPDCLGEVLFRHQYGQLVTFLQRLDTV